MTDVYLYADETGNLDYGGAGKQGASDYFGFETAVYYGDHGAALMEGLSLRVKVTAEGVRLARGFHAVDDSNTTRGEMFAVVGTQAPRLTPPSYGSRPYPNVRAAGEMRLYKLAWYLHFKEIASQVSAPGDRLLVIAGTFGTRKRRVQAEAALADVCAQVDRDITLCVWDAASSWGSRLLTTRYGRSIGTCVADRATGLTWRSGRRSAARSRHVDASPSLRRSRQVEAGYPPLGKRPPGPLVTGMPSKARRAHRRLPLEHHVHVPCDGLRTRPLLGTFR